MQKEASPSSRPLILTFGYLNAAAVAKESLETGKSLRQIVLERELMNPDDLAKVLDLEQMSTLQKADA
jgi:aspartate ammonia-lyase